MPMAKSIGAGGSDIEGNDYKNISSLGFSYGLTFKTYVNAAALVSQIIAGQFHC